MANFDQLLRELAGNDPAAQLRARQTLLALDEQAVSPLVDAFYAGVNEAQGLALLDVVTEIGGPEAQTLLTDIVFDSSARPAFRHKAALGLARAGRDDLLDPLLDWLQNGSLDERRTAVLSLGYIGGDEADTALTHALHEPELAAQAVVALRMRGNVQGLATGYSTDNAEVWRVVTDALIDLGDAGALPLIDILQNEHPEFYDAVLVSLQNLDRPEAREILHAGDFSADGARKDDDDA